MKYNIIGVDPGESTGVVYWRRSIVGHAFDQVDISVKTLTINNGIQVYHILDEYYSSEFTRLGDCLLIVEDYEIRPGSRITHSKAPLKIIGFMELLADKHDHVDLIINRPLHKKGINEDVLDAYGFKGVKFETEHEKDAAKHIARYLTNKYYSVDIFNPNFKECTI